MRKDFSQRQTTLDFIVDPTLRELPLRADQFLTMVISQRSRNQLQKVFKQNRVLMHGRPISASTKLKGREEIIVLLDPEMEYVPPETIPLNIIYEDEWILAVNKNAGLLMHPTGNTLSGTLLNVIHHYYREQGSDCRPVLLQRLDRNTSGLVILAKSDAIHQEIQKQLVGHDLDKIYIALCEGNPQPSDGYYNVEIGEVYHKEVKKMAPGPSDTSKPSLTCYTQIAHESNLSLMGILLCTGRQHQIRVHFSHAGHPLIGDTLYGSTFPFPRQALHAYYLKFYHPVLKKDLELYADIPEDIMEIVQNLEISDSYAHTWDKDCTHRPWNPHTWLDNAHKLRNLAGWSSSENANLQDHES